MTLANNGWYPPPGIPPSEYYVYLRDLATGITKLVPSIPNTNGGVRYSHHLLDISPDGRYLLVNVNLSSASSDPSANRPGKYVVDMATGTMLLTPHVDGTGDADRLVGDGSTFVVRRHSNVVEGDWDLINYRTGEVATLNMTPTGGHLPSFNVAISGDGRTVVFLSRWGEFPHVNTLYRRNLISGEIQAYQFDTTQATYTLSSETLWTSYDGTVVFGHGRVGGVPNTLAVSIPGPADTVAPTVTGTPDPAPNASGWYNAPVMVTWTAADPPPSSGAPTTPPPTVVSDEGRNLTVTSGQSCDPAGNCATGAVTVSIDRTAPTVTVNGVVDGRDYVLGTQPSPTAIACSASDALSGLAGPCTGELTGGNAAGVGTFTYTASATDVAGNRTTVTVRYRVVYGFAGFAEPLKASPTPQALNAGRTVPVKFQLTRSDGSIITPASTPVWITPQRGGPITAPCDEGVFPATPTAADTYRLAGAQWLFNWNTDKNQAGSYWRVGVQLDDGTVHYVVVALR